ncbi:MAG: RagB/SusD family nutrient uptake outer membrane protein [Prevotella sp.]|nr:RagB/SusD family nutrient uptake outer membrane protein [Prevotella sp.]
MKRFRYIRILVAILIIFSGCDLDTSPSLQLDGENLTDGDVEALTLGSYAYMKEDNGVMRAFHYIGEFGGDNISLSGTTSDPLMYIYDYNRITTSTRVGYLWDFSYKTIININGTLERIHEGESLEKNHLIGENLYLRAYHYFLLVNTFGQPYINNPTQNLGIPLKLTTSMDDFPARATVAETYDQIIKDLEKAVELMEIPAGSVIKPKDNAYASKEVAEALLSRVYLYMENWEKAELYATNVINSGRYQLTTGTKYANYATYNPANNEETIFAVKFNKDDKKYTPFYMVGSLYTKVDEKGWGEMYPSYPYLMLLDRFPQDLRQSYIVRQLSDTKGYWFIYPKSDYSGYTTVPVEKSDDNYTIINPDGYGDSEVKKETYRGGDRYYILNSYNEKIYGRVEEQCKLRNGYPMYYMNKLVLQEGQADLYSPVVSRFAEMYLNRAEARYHRNNIDGAISDINIIRARAGIPTWTRSKNPVPGEITIPEDYPISDVILDERRMELAFEAHRRFDIYRNKNSLNRDYPGGHITSKGPRNLNYNDKKIVEYIPEKEIQAYPNSDLLVQNP